MRATRNGISPTTNSMWMCRNPDNVAHRQLLSIDQVWRRSTALTWSRWGCRRLADNIWLLAHDNNNHRQIRRTDYKWYWADGRPLYDASGDVLKSWSRSAEACAVWMVAKKVNQPVVNYVCCLLVVLVKLSVLAKWLARKTPLTTPNSRGDYLHKDQAEEHRCAFCVDSVDCLIVCPSPVRYISHVRGTV